jgi:FkbM family methyltransferase
VGERHAGAEPWQTATQPRPAGSAGHLTSCRLDERPSHPPELTSPRRLRSLYVCYLSLDDPLVRTQVVAYIAGLVRGGHAVHLLTFETAKLTRARRRELRAQMAAEGIAWHGLRYHKRPSLPATVLDTFLGAAVSAALMRRHRLGTFHARSHIPAAMALLARPLARFQLLFDIRGILAEEYVDAGNWKRGSVPYRLTAGVQRAAIRRAAGMVVLTHRVRRVLFDDADDRVEVIPCCADVEAVQRAAAGRDDVRTSLGLQDRTVLLYVGKLGGWYLQREMVEFFVRAQAHVPDLHLLVLTQSDRALIDEELRRCEVTERDCTVTAVTAQEVPAHLVAADAAMAFIRPTYSKISSSPTKIGEYLAAGLPVVTGRGIGDVDAQLERHGAGIVLDAFTPEALEDGARALAAAIGDPELAERARRCAREELSLRGVGIPAYERLYERLARASALPAFGSPAMGDLKQTLKRIRATPAINIPVTSLVRAALRRTGREGRFAVEHLPRVGTVRSRLPNGATLRLRSAGDDWIPNQLFWHGFDAYDAEAMPVFLRLAADARVVVDVGAYIGLYALAAALTSPRARVVAFEPLPAVHARLEANVAANGARVECVCSAVGEQPGTAEFFHVPSPDLPSSSSLSRDFMSVHEAAVGTPVPVVTLDGFCAANGIDAVDLVKIDTETTEPAVLRGMTEILARDRPDIVCEVLPGHGVEPELERILRPLGYAFHLLTDAGPVRRESIAGDPTWHNHLFTARGSA